jgi:hypothetical protein
LKVRKALSKSFSSVAITAIALTCSFVVVMDLLKYAFHVDPLKAQRAQMQANEQAKRNNAVHAPPMAVRFQYVA